MVSRRGARVIQGTLALAAVILALAPGVVRGGATAPPTPAPPTQPLPPGVAASAQTVGELRRLLDEAVRRFEARDTAGVLAHVSDQYRTSPMTKPLIRDNLRTFFGLYDAVRARVRIDEVRMVGDQAWVWSTGEVTGRLIWAQQWMSVLSWERELEVARREGGRWRLYGYQQ